MGKATKKNTGIPKEAKSKLAKLLLIDTRETFVLAMPHINAVSKSSLQVATFLFAGSVTFLGLRKDVVDTDLLKWSWVVLGVSVLLYLLTHIAVLVTLMSHGRTETDAKRAKAVLSAGGLSKEFLRETYSSFSNQQMFFLCVKLAIAVLIGQALATIVGGVLMGLFIWQNT